MTSKNEIYTIITYSTQKHPVNGANTSRSDALRRRIGRGDPSGTWAVGSPPIGDPNPGSDAVVQSATTGA